MITLTEIVSKKRLIIIALLALIFLVSLIVGITLYLQNKGTSLEIRSLTPDAKVILDPKGGEGIVEESFALPKKFKNITLGIHKVEVYKDGYFPVTKDVEIKENQKARLEVKLIPVRFVSFTKLVTDTQIDGPLFWSSENALFFQAFSNKPRIDRLRNKKIDTLTNLPSRATVLSWSTRSAALLINNKVSLFTIPQELTDLGIEADLIAISEKHGQVAYSNKNQLRIISLTGNGSATQIDIPPTSQVSELEWSPFGNSLAFSLNEGANSKIYLKNESSKSIEIYNSKEKIENLKFSPKGSYISFFSDGKINFLPLVNNAQIRSYPLSQNLIGKTQIWLSDTELIVIEKLPRNNGLDLDYFWIYDVFSGEKALLITSAPMINKLDLKVTPAVTRNGETIAVKEKAGPIWLLTLSLQEPKTSENGE